MKKPNKGLRAAFPAALLAMAATLAGATGASSPAAPAVQEFQEAVSHAMRLEDRIFDRERRFYARYNELNEADALDVTCNILWNDGRWGAGVLINRGCVPNFLGDALATGAGRDAPVRCPASAAAKGTGIQVDADGVLRRAELQYARAVGPCYTALHATSTTHTAPAWQARHDEFRANVARLVSGDAELQALAADLQDLIDAGDASRERIAEARHASWVSARCVQPPGPRQKTRGGCDQ
jgi:hypothetical protein